MGKEKKGKAEFLKVQLEVNLKECWVMWSCWLLLGIVTCGYFTSNICLRVHLFFPPWPQSLGSHKYLALISTGLPDVAWQMEWADNALWQKQMKLCHLTKDGGNDGYMLLQGKKGFWSRKGDEQELSSVFFPSQRVAEWRSYNTEILVSSSNFDLNTVIK